MGRTRTVFVCQSCGVSAAKWAGRCASCDEWNCLVEEIAPSAGTARPLVALTAAAQPIEQVGRAGVERLACGIDEVDRVLGGGLVEGTVALVGGAPGIGKSTLLLEMVAAVARRGTRTLYLSAEESAQQIRGRAERLDALHGDVWLAAETEIERLVHHVDTVGARVVVVDSIQTVHDDGMASAPGSVGQVRHCAQRLVTEAKRRGVAVVLVSHVTKEGSLAGPRTMEHLVDTVLSFDGDRHHALRMLRATKNRFGPTGELGLFEMSDSGLLPVADPSRLFLADRQEGTAGSVVVPTMEGHRPMLVEIQSLVVPSSPGNARRSAQGVDAGRLAVLLAVLERRLQLPTAGQDVFVSAVGGAKVAEPAADLGLVLAVTSAALDRALPAGLLVCGEVGLGGEVRQVAQIDRRLAEAARLGFDAAMIPATAEVRSRGVRLLPVRSLHDAVALTGLGDTGDRRRPPRSVRSDGELLAVGDEVATVSLLEPAELDERRDRLVHPLA